MDILWWAQMARWPLVAPTRMWLLGLAARALSVRRCATVQEMKEGPSRSANRCWSRSAATRCWQKRWPVPNEVRYQSNLFVFHLAFKPFIFHSGELEPCSVAVENLVTGLARYPELWAHVRHRLPIQQAGDKAKALFHHRTLFPRHQHSRPAKSGKCNLCVRYECSRCFN